MHVGHPITQIMDTELGRIGHLGDHDHHCPSLTPGGNGVDHHECVCRVEQQLDQVDAGGTDLDQLHALRHALARELLHHVDPDPVVAPQYVPKPGNEYPHGGRLRSAVDALVIAELERRLTRFPADRYPLQHAATLFQLGAARLHEGDLVAAIESFRRSTELFEPLPYEQAKSSNMAGIALREAGRPAESATSFEAAATVFASRGEPREEAAARYNLGLVRGQLHDRASVHFAAALELFRSVGATREVAAATRELGQAHLVEGDVGIAIGVLQSAVAAAEECRDPAGKGAAANALGLAHLAAGTVESAIEAFRVARSSHPRSLRPAEHAMAAANLAIALERVGDAPRARLAARQAHAVPAADVRVRDQCNEMLARLGNLDGDLVVVFDAEDHDGRGVTMRNEIERWADETVDHRVRAVTAVAVELGQADRTDELAEALLSATLELPPARFATVLSAVAAAVTELDADGALTARARLARAAATFHLPQMARLEQHLRAFSSANEGP